MSVDYADLTDNGEFEEVKDSDFAPTIDWNATPLFVGTFDRTVTKSIKGKDRVIHNFTAEDGSELEAWGAAILDSRLKQVPAGARVKIQYLGKTAKTQSGNMCHNFKVLVAKSALRAS